MSANARCSVLRLIGAKDVYIAVAFARRFSLRIQRAAIGSLSGAVVFFF